MTTQTTSKDLIKRYRATKSGMFQMADGQWVSWSDHRAEIERLQREQSQMTSLAGSALTQLHERVTAHEPPAARPLTLHGFEIMSLVEFLGGDPDTDVSIAHYEAAKDVESGEDMPSGHYAWCTEYPEEGRVHLSTEPPASAPPPGADDAMRSERDHYKSEAENLRGLLNDPRRNVAFLYYCEDDSGCVYLIGATSETDAHQRLMQAEPLFRGTEIKRLGSGFRGVITFTRECPTATKRSDAP